MVVLLDVPLVVDVVVEVVVMEEALPAEVCIEIKSDSHVMLLFRTWRWWKRCRGRSSS